MSYLYEKLGRVKWLDVPENTRIIVISDVHANLPYLMGVLKKVGFSDRDILIFDGDFLEKGERSMDTLHCIMKLAERGNVYAVCGNCDDWAEIFNADEATDEQVLRYILWRKSGLLWEMLNGAGIDPFEMESLTAVKKTLFNSYLEEWKFLARIPHAVETEKYIFAHAGMNSQKPLRENLVGELIRNDALMKQGQKFEKWMIVGHWPVVLYGENKVCANPVIDRDAKIVSIDGGCVLKDDGQLNALIIPNKHSEDFCFMAYDPFPVRKVLDSQSEGKQSYYIRWGDSRVQVLERGEEFSRCRHERTGYEMDILTKYLFSDTEFTDCNDSTDYILPLHAGDEVSVVEETSRGYLVKHNGTSGWYYGRLE